MICRILRSNSLTISYLKFFSLVISMLFFLPGCCSEPEESKLAITGTDASCTEAWIQVTGEIGKEILLTRDDREVKRFTLRSSPTEVMDDTLEPSKTYTYYAIRSDNGERSNAAAITTLDTTSDNISWQTYLLGQGAGSSFLADVAIINDTMAYAVGEIYRNDTTFNAARWNGQTWELKRLLYIYAGSPIYSSVTWIYAIDANDIWYGNHVHWNGQSFNNIDIADVIFYGIGSSKMWGDSNGDLCIVGRNGTIAHSLNHGSTWTKIESGTTLPFQDIWGSGGEILAIASDKFGMGGKYLVTISGNTATQVSTDIPTAISFSSLWFVSGRRYYLAGNGVYTKRSLSDSSWQRDGVNAQITDYCYSVRGNGLNDVVIVCENGTIVHFNGKNWKTHGYAGQAPGDRLQSVSVKGNLIIAVGTKYVDGMTDRALVCVGRRA